MSWVLTAPADMVADVGGREVVNGAGRNLSALSTPCTPRTLETFVVLPERVRASGAYPRA